MKTAHLVLAAVCAVWTIGMGMASYAPSYLVRGMWQLVCVGAVGAALAVGSAVLRPRTRAGLLAAVVLVLVNVYGAVEAGVVIARH